MKLQEALLCVDCEALYSLSSHCPECGSQVAYPLVRALNRDAAATNIPASPASKPRRRGHGHRGGSQREAGVRSVPQRA